MAHATGVSQLVDACQITLVSLASRTTRVMLRLCSLPSGSVVVS
jgi:hypothetical protein